MGQSSSAESLSNHNKDRRHAANSSINTSSNSSSSSSNSNSHSGPASAFSPESLASSFPHSSNPNERLDPQTAAAAVAAAAAVSGRTGAPFNPATLLHIATIPGSVFTDELSFSSYKSSINAALVEQITARLAIPSTSLQHQQQHQQQPQQQSPQSQQPKVASIASSPSVKDNLQTQPAKTNSVTATKSTASANQTAPVPTPASIADFEKISLNQTTSPASVTSNLTRLAAAASAANPVQVSKPSASTPASAPALPASVVPSLNQKPQPNPKLSNLSPPPLPPKITAVPVAISSSATTNSKSVAAAAGTRKMKKHVNGNPAPTAAATQQQPPPQQQQQQEQPKTRTTRQQIASTHAVAAIMAQRARMAQAAQNRDTEAEKLQSRTVNGRVTKGTGGTTVGASAAASVKAATAGKASSASISQPTSSQAPPAASTGIPTASSAIAAALSQSPNLQMTSENLHRLENVFENVEKMLAGATVQKMLAGPPGGAAASAAKDNPIAMSDISSTATSMQELLEAAAVLSSDLFGGNNKDVVDAAAEFKALASDAGALAKQIGALRRPGTVANGASPATNPAAIGRGMAGIPTAVSASASSVSSSGSSTGSTDRRFLDVKKAGSVGGPVSAPTSPVRPPGPSGVTPVSAMPTKEMFSKHQPQPSYGPAFAGFSTAPAPSSQQRNPNNAISFADLPLPTAIRQSAMLSENGVPIAVPSNNSGAPRVPLSTSPQRPLPPGTILNHNNKPIRLPTKKTRSVNIPLPLPPPSTLHLIRRDDDDDDEVPVQHRTGGVSQGLEITRFDDEDRGSFTGSEDDDAFSIFANGTNGTTVSARPIGTASTPSRLSPAKKKMGVTVASKKKRVGGLSTSAPSAGGFNDRDLLWTEAPSAAVIGLLRGEDDDAAPVAAETSLSVLGSRSSSVPTPGPLTGLGLSAVNVTPAAVFPDSLFDQRAGAGDSSGSVGGNESGGAAGASIGAGRHSGMFEFGKTQRTVSASVVSNLKIATTPLAGKRKATHSTPPQLPVNGISINVPSTTVNSVLSPLPPAASAKSSPSPGTGPQRYAQSPGSQNGASPTSPPGDTSPSRGMNAPPNGNPALNAMPRNADGLIEWEALDAPVPYGTLPIDISNLPDLLEDRELEEIDRLERNPPPPPPQTVAPKQGAGQNLPPPSRLTPAERRLLDAVDSVTAPTVTSRSRRRARLAGLLRKSGSRGGVGVAGAFPGGGGDWCFFCEFEMLFGGGAVWKRAAVAAAASAIAAAAAPAVSSIAPPPTAHGKELPPSAGAAGTPQPAATPTAAHGGGTGKKGRDKG